MGQSCRGSGIAALTWLVEYASVLLNRYAVASDGKTAYKRMRGKKSRVLGIEFGEKVHWRRAIPASHRSNKLDMKKNTIRNQVKSKVSPYWRE